jgi:hypothetical protein
VSLLSLQIDDLFGVFWNKDVVGRRLSQKEIDYCVSHGSEKLIMENFHLYIHFLLVVQIKHQFRFIERNLGIASFYEQGKSERR